MHFCCIYILHITFFGNILIYHYERVGGFMFDFQAYVGFLLTIIVCNISLTEPLHNQQENLDISKYTEFFKIEKASVELIL